jgi:PAS domain S-box-containing protein
MTEPVADDMTIELLSLRDEVERLRRAQCLREQADSQWQAQEERTRGILDSVACGILHISNDGRIQYANSHARRLLNLTQQELSGLTLRDFESRSIWPSGNHCEYDDYPAIKCLRTGEPQPATTIGLRLLDGNVQWAMIAAVAVLDSDSGRPASVIVTFTDINHSRHIEESLRQSEDRYRRLVEQAPDAIVVHRDGTIVFANDAAVQLWGAQSRSDLLGRDLLEFLHPRHRQIVKHRVQQSMAGETVALVDQLHLRFDGRVVHVEVTGLPCIYDGHPSVQAIFRDVTKRKRAERQVRKQREILKKFFDRIPAIVGFFDVEGRVKLVNRQWKRVLGWGKDLSTLELIALGFPDPEKRQEAADFWKTAQPGWKDFRVLVRDGRTLDISWAKIVLTDGTRIVIGKDVTKGKAREEALRRAKSELEQRVEARTLELSRKNLELQVEVAERRRAESQLQEKQRFLERMLSTHERDRQLVAYEIHDSFLQDVIAALMFIDASYDTRHETGEQAIERLERARKLLRKSIDEARRMISGLRPPIIDEQGIVAAIEYLVNEWNSRGLKIHFLHALQVQRLNGIVEAAIFRIVQEALTNVERHSQSHDAQVTLTQPGETIRLAIRDFGVGFDPGDVGEGHFGLQGIQERARLIGAAVSINSRPNEGTEIIVEIPARAARSAPGAAPPLAPVDG